MAGAEALEAAALQRELREAVEADERWRRQNRAKLRAVRQPLASYEEFRNIVLASHLKPLEKKDKMGVRGKVLWNPCAAQATTPAASTLELPQELDQLPRTSAEFYRDWRRCLKSGKEKYQLLLELGGKGLGRIFRAELGFGLLGEFLTVLAENVCEEDRDAVLQILQSLAGTPRFGLSVMLLSPQERSSSRALLGKLRSMSGGSWASSRPGSAAGHEAHGGAQLTDASLQKEAEEDGAVMELMKCYQVS
ncbi:CC103 protein, partial [Urocolius indicus]|nr:CC103 protein [Urocolius indicus]